jgi:hypothetical protein
MQSFYGALPQAIACQPAKLVVFRPTQFGIHRKCDGGFLGYGQIIPGLLLFGSV